MCKFDEAWIGKCKNENVKGQEYCAKHIEVKCSVCGSQADHSCEETNQFVCGTPLCDSLKCKLVHFYQQHGYALMSVASYEKKLNIKPFKLVVAKINYGDDEFGKFANEHYADRLEAMLMTFNDEGKVKFYNAHFRYYIKFKEEIPDLFKSTWYDKIIKEKDVFYSEEPIRINDLYDVSIENKLEKVEL